MFRIFFFENLALNEMTSKNVVEPERSQMAIWRMGVADWISNATRARAHASVVHPHPHERTHTRTHTEVCEAYCFHGNNGFANAPQYYVIRTTQ